MAIPETILLCIASIVFIMESTVLIMLYKNTNLLKENIKMRVKRHIFTFNFITKYIFTHINCQQSVNMWAPIFHELQRLS